MKDVSSFDFYLLDTSPLSQFHSDKVDKAFWFWKTSWEQTFKKLGVNSKSSMTSDEFLFKKMLALFDEDEPVALIFYSEVDISKECVCQSAYFKHYPQACVDFFKNKFNRIFILSHISVHPEYRKKNTNVPLSELMFSLGMRAFQESESEALIGYIRYEIKDIFYRHGAIKVTSGHQNNIDVDYCYVSQADVKPTTFPMVAKVAQDLWFNKNRREEHEYYLGLRHNFKTDEQTL